MPAGVDADVRKAGLGLLIVAAIPALFSVLAFRYDDMELLRAMKVNGLIGAAVFVVLGLPVLARKWQALYVAAGVCVTFAVAIAYFALTKRKPQGWVLAGAILVAAPYFARVGGALRKATT